MLPLPLRETAIPRPIAAAAARVQTMALDAALIVLVYGVGKDDMAMVYMSPDPFFDAFEEDLDLRKWSFDKHCTAGLSLLLHNGRLYLGGMAPGTPGAKVDRWRVNLRGAWLNKIGTTVVSTISKAQSAFQALYCWNSICDPAVLTSQTEAQYIEQGTPYRFVRSFYSANTQPT
jgi:hypothetical protein